jgi:hypothetical protein
MSAGAPGQARVEAADFAQRFAEYCAAPTPQRLETILAERVRLVAPLTPTTETLEEAKRVFARLLASIPDLRGEVHRWGTTVDGVLIEFTLRGSAGGAPIGWQAVDRFVLGEDGMATERISYVDPTPLLRAVALRPRAWPGFLRSRFSTRMG